MSPEFESVAKAVFLIGMGVIGFFLQRTANLLDRVEERVQNHEVRITVMEKTKEE